MLCWMQNAMERAEKQQNILKKATTYSNAKLKNGSKVI